MLIEKIEKALERRSKVRKKRKGKKEKNGDRRKRGIAIGVG